MRHSIDWAGDMIQSPHGDWCHVRDVEGLQDELERSLKALDPLKARIAELEAQLAQVKPVESVERLAEGYRLFGWANPNDARSFNSGKKDYCRLFKKRTDIFCMPVSNALGPNHYQKPPLGELVTIGDGHKTKVLRHCPEGLVCEGLIDLEMIVTKWSWNPCKN